MRKNMHVRNFIIAVTIGLAMSYAAYPDEAPRKNADAKSATGAALTTGELRNIDHGRAADTVTISRLGRVK